MQCCKQILFLLTFLSPISLFAQTPNLVWIEALAEEILEETDLCERCTWVKPSITKVDFNNDFFYFLRYNCSISDSYARMYDASGQVVGECTGSAGANDCGFGFNAFTIYTLSETIIPIWSCDKGFECAFVLENNVEQDIPIQIDDTRCAEGIKTLTVAAEFTSYQWQGASITGNESSLVINEGGDYFVTVTDELGCEFEAEISIPDITALNVAIKGAKEICSATATTLTTTNFETYQWSTGATTKDIEAVAGTYQLSVTNEQACEGTADFTLNNYETLAIAITADKTNLTEGETVNATLRSGSTSAISEIEWTGTGIFDCMDCAAIQFTPQITGELRVDILDNRGCMATASVFISLKELPLEVYAPNVFQPSSVDENALFTIYGGDNVQEISELAIFDRWGNQVFNNLSFAPNQPRSGWDGRMNGQDLMQDVYIYWAKVLFLNGEEIIISGDVLLLR